MSLYVYVLCAHSCLLYITHTPYNTSLWTLSRDTFVKNNQQCSFVLLHLNIPITFFCIFHSRTNVLSRYFNKDFTVTLPDNKKLTDIKWLAIYDLTSQVRKTVWLFSNSMVVHLNKMNYLYSAPKITIVCSLIYRIVLKYKVCPLDNVSNLENIYFI